MDQGLVHLWAKRCIGQIAAANRQVAECAGATRWSAGYAGMRVEGGIGLQIAGDEETGDERETGGADRCGISEAVGALG